MLFKGFEEHALLLPEGVRARFREIAAPLDAFCERYLNEEYRDASCKLAARLCAEHVPATRGRAGGWAAGVVHALGETNFLSDPEFSPCITIDAVAEEFGVAVSTVQAKARVIRNLFNVYYPNPEWRLEHALAQDPLVWMHIIDGHLIDFRQASHKEQEQAFADGLIPYIHADRHERPGIAGKQVIARIGPGGVVEMEAALLAPADMDAPFGPLLSALDDLLATPATDTPAPKRRKGAPQVFDLKITLMGTKPSIYRRVAVKSDIRLSVLHHVIQAAMGWHDCHMHEFRTRDEFRFGDVSQDDGLEDVADEHRYRLHDLVAGKGDRFFYTYDFGDDWEHRVELMKIATCDSKVEYPVCIGGKRACPPEDCGGVWGFYDMLEALDNPSSEMHEEYREWLPDGFDPDAFDVEGANQRLAYSRR